MQRSLRHVVLPIVLATCASSAFAHNKPAPKPVITTFTTAEGIKFTTTQTGNSLVLTVDGRAAKLQGESHFKAISLGNLGNASGVVLAKSPFFRPTLDRTNIGAGGCGTGAAGTSSSQLCLDGIFNLPLNQVQEFKLTLSGDVKFNAADLKLTLAKSSVSFKGTMYEASFGTKTGGYVKNDGASNGGGSQNGGGANNGGGTTTPTPPPTTPEVPPSTPEVPPTTPEVPPTTPEVPPSTPEVPPTTTPEVPPTTTPELPPTPPVTNEPGPTPDPELIPEPDLGGQPPITTVPVDTGDTGNGGQNPSEVPEPQSLLLLAGGLGALALLRRRKARK